VAPDAACVCDLRRHRRPLLSRHRGGSGRGQGRSLREVPHYLKLFYLEKSPSAEPFADDAATLSLDLLMSEEGYARGGVNLFLLPGVNS